jgi:hypothetical protein
MQWAHSAGLTARMARVWLCNQNTVTFLPGWSLQSHILQEDALKFPGLAVQGNTSNASGGQF